MKKIKLSEEVKETVRKMIKTQEEHNLEKLTLFVLFDALMTNNWFSSLLAKYSSCEDDVNEAIQQTIILIYDKLYQLRNENKVGTWIMRILINQCKKIYKQNQLRNRKNVNLEDNIEKININEEKDDYSFVDNAIHRLDTKYREIIILYYYDELKIKDIAKVLKIPQGTIKTRLNRARKKLNEILKEVNVNE